METDIKESNVLSVLKQIIYLLKDARKKGLVLSGKQSQSFTIYEITNHYIQQALLSDNYTMPRYDYSDNIAMSNKFDLTELQQILEQREKELQAINIKLEGFVVALGEEIREIGKNDYFLFSVKERNSHFSMF